MNTSRKSRVEDWSRVLEALQVHGESIGISPETVERLRLELGRGRDEQQTAGREDEDRLRLALEGGELGTWDFNLRTFAFTFDRRCEELFGLPRGARVDYDVLLGYVHPEDREATDRAAKVSFEPTGNGCFDHEYRIVRPDGRTRWLRCKGRASFEGEGERRRAVRMVGTTQDITELKQAQAELKRAKNAAESASAAKDRFLAMLSHELRTPLTPAAMLSAELESDMSLPERVREDLLTIRRNIQVQVRLVEDLLDLSRITSGKLTLQCVPVDLHDVLRTVAPMWTSGIDEKRLKFQWELFAERHWIRGDEARIQQVFWNLIGNAVKFTPEEGRIRVRSSNPAEGQVEIEVCDSGIGIKAPWLDRIFAAFEQGEEGRGHGGLGLGLAITKAIVELHHGSISASSEGEGCGATFTVRVPTIAEPVNAPKKLEAPKMVPSLRILLVEDHEDTGRTLARLLRADGHAVEHVSSAGAALDAAGQRSFDLLISDLGLPDVSGFELMRQVRSQHGLRGIAVSGYGTEADLRASHEAGFEAHVTKPIEIEELKTAIGQLFGSRAPENGRNGNASPGPADNEPAGPHG